MAVGGACGTSEGLETTAFWSPGVTFVLEERAMFEMEWRGDGLLVGTAVSSMVASMVHPLSRIAIRKVRIRRFNPREGNHR
jgi:hypothetical protein